MPLRAAATALLGVALCLAGGTFDSPSLYVPGVALLVLSVVAAVWVELAARGATLTRQLGPHTVLEEKPYPLRVEVRAGAVPPPGGELVEPLLNRSVPIAGRWEQRLRIDVRFARRGLRRLEPGVLAIRDPLRLHEREVRGGQGGEVLVLPRVEPVVAAGGAGAGGAAAGASGGGDIGVRGRRLDAATAELEIDGLRPYREGAPASRIHWPTVARTGTMVERRLVADLDAAPLIVLDAAAPASEEALDMAVRATASLCLHLAREGGCALLLPGQRRPVDIGHDLGAWPALHARLAVVEAGSAPHGGALLPRAGSVLWVTGADLSRAPRSLKQLPTAARFVVSPSPLPRGAPAFTVAGCTGQLVDRAGNAVRRRAAA
ncbi:MAG TPA: DUF58 domain-containing protein [Thermoleophilaceae bacterium]